MQLKSSVICTSGILWINHLGDLYTYYFNPKVLLNRNTFNHKYLNEHRYKNAAINLFFNFLDICFGIYILLLLFYGGRMYQSPNDCLTEAPALFFFLETFLLVIVNNGGIYYNGIIFAILFLAFVSYVLKRFSKSQQVYDENKEEFYDA